MQKKLYSDILEAANLINNRARTGSANYILLSPDMSKLFFNPVNNIRKEKINKILNG